MRRRRCWSSAGATDSRELQPVQRPDDDAAGLHLHPVHSPGVGPDGGEPPGYARAWGAALVLIVLVMVLNLIARIIGTIFAPKTERRR